MSIYFCNDGVLRTQDINNKFFISLEFFQEEEGFDDFPFWVGWWNQPVIFEQGLTLASFFKCLEPWAQFWGTYLQKDLNAFCYEIKKPISINKVKQFDWISLDYHTELYPRVTYPLDDTAPIIEKDWRIHSNYQLFAYNKDIESQHAIHYHPLNQLANIPFVLNAKEIMMVDEFFTQKYSSPTQNLLNSKALGVYQMGGDDNYPFSYVVSEKSHLFKEVLEGFFSHFDYSPQDRDEINSHIEENMNHLIEQSNIQIQENNFDLLEEIFLEHRELVHHFKPIDSDEYQQIFKTGIKNTEDSKLRIGYIQAASAPENRILTTIIKKEI